MKSKTFRILAVFMVVSIMLCALVVGLHLVDPDPAQATNHFIQINEVMAGYNGDSSVQFIEIESNGAGQKCWGPQDGTNCPGSGETVGRAMLLFFDAAGNQTGRYVFQSDPNTGGTNTVLIATQEFANLAGAPTPDFILPQPELIPNSGQVCFRANPDNGNGDNINLCLSYGNFTGAIENNANGGDPLGGPFTGPPNGSPVSTILPILDSVSLNRTQSISGGKTTGIQNNLDFASTSNPNPQNTGGASFSFPAVGSQAEQGGTVFLQETFNGNGRTCGSCHRPESDFGLSPQDVAQSPADDPLFIAEFNIDTITMTASTQPSDFRGIVTASSGATATILAGTEAAYLVIGGNAISNATVLTDTFGNTGTLQAFSAGDIDQLEDPTLMRGGQALILENVDGFANPPVTRGSPHLLNIMLTGPFGQSPPFGGAGNLNGFAIGATTQHLPRSLNRVAGVDFRMPLVSELDAMTAFMNTIFNPADQNFDLDRFATTEAQKRGRAIFFGGVAKCSICHNGDVLATSDGTNGTTLGVNEDFDIGLPDLQHPSGSVAREFSVPPLFGVKNTAPFFHDNSRPTLREVIEFYGDVDFNGSPAAGQVGPIILTISEIDDLLAFLESLTDLPFEMNPPRPGSLSFGSQDVDAGPTAAQTVVITNTGSMPISVLSTTLVGSGASHFTVGVVSGAPFGQGSSRDIDVQFDPSITGLLTTTLEIVVTDTNESWAVGVLLSGGAESSYLPIILKQ